LNSALRRLGYPNDIHVGHGFRSSFSTLANGRKLFDPDIIEAALAHDTPGVRGIYAGRLRNCGQIEALTANLVSINRRYKAHAGLRVTDI